MKRLKDKLRSEFRRGRGRNLGRFITEDLQPLLKGWINYFRVDEVRAWTSATNRRGPWWNSGASHMNQAIPKGFFNRLGLVNLQTELRRLQYVS